MDPHNVHRRQPHSALRRKRSQPARLVDLPTRELDNVSNPGSHAVGVAPRQLPGDGSLPGLPDITDLFPPLLPTDDDEVTSIPPTLLPPTSTTIDDEPTSTPPPSSSTTTTTTPSPSTTSTPTTTSTTPPPSPAAPTSTRPPSPVVVTELDSQTVVVTSSRTQTTASSTLPGVGAKNTNAPEDSGSGTGPIVGGIVAGVIALAVLVIAIVWFMRRRKRAEVSDADLQKFNPHDFRRSAVLLNDDAYGAAGSGGAAGLSRGYSINSGGHNDSDPTLRPPTMIERKLAHTPVNGGYEHSGFAGAGAYAPSSHGHGDYGYGAGGYGAEAPPSAPFGYNHYQGYDNYQHYSGPPFHTYMPQPPLQPGQVVDQGYGQPGYGNPNPFTSPVQDPQQHQEYSSFSPPPVSQENETYGESHDAVGAMASPPSSGANMAVLAQVGGAPVLTRSVSSKSISTRSTRSGKSGQLSISIPKNTPVPNAMVVNEGAPVAPGAVGNTGIGADSKVEHPALARQDSTESQSVLTGGIQRKPSNGRTLRESAEVPTGDFVDLSRSSVSPFQAAQYAEISKRLNTDLPVGLQTGHSDQQRNLPSLPQDHSSSVDEASQKNRQPPASPFADPVGHQERPDRKSKETSHSSISGSGVVVPMANDFPIPPPSPLALYSRHSPVSPAARVNSLPPQLPEINVNRNSVEPSGVSSSSHDHSAYGSYLAGPSGGLGVAMNDSPGHYPSGITAGGSPLLGRFPVTPSPLGVSFGLDTPKTGELSGAAVRSEQGVFMRLQEEEKEKEMRRNEEKERRKAEKERSKLASENNAQQSSVTDDKEKRKEKERPVTVYDDTDPYGGI